MPLRLGTHQEYYTQIAPYFEPILVKFKTQRAKTLCVF